MTPEQISRCNLLKSNFKTFFDGCYDIPPQSNITTREMGVTNISFEVKDNEYIMTIELLYPGFLIGKAGKTITEIYNFLSSEEYPIKFNLVESKLWNPIK